MAWFDGVGATGRGFPPVSILTAGEPPGRDLRARLSRHIQASVEGAGGAVAASLATGDQGAIPEADAEAMRRSGLAHLLSVSGLHLTAVVGAVMLLTLKLLALGPTLALRFRLVLVAAAAGALAGLAYTLLPGAEVPTIRACIAAMLVLAGIALGREAITLRLVAVGALVVLLFWPESLAGASFQLSFAAITAIVALHEHPRVKALLARRDEGMAQKSARFLGGLILTGLAVELALTPIALFHFHKAGLYGALANVVAIPLTTFIFMPLEALALLFDVAGLGAPFWWAAKQALSLLLGLAHMAASAPGAVAMLPSMPTGAFALMVAGGLWLCLWRTRWRGLGLAPFAAGALWTLTTPAPDLLAESAGLDVEPSELDTGSASACSRDLCAAHVDRGGRRWTILATRTRHYVEIAEMQRACAVADIVVSERRLPRTCRPRWLKADRDFFARTGGIAVTLGEPPSVATVAAQVGRHPWAASGVR